MASNPITSWQIDAEPMETVTDFIFWGSKITVDGDGSHKIKRGLLLGRKAMTNLDSILKSRDIILLIKVHIIKAMVFPQDCCSASLSCTRFQGGRQGRTKSAPHLALPPPDPSRCAIRKLPRAAHWPDLCHTPTIPAAREARNAVF